ncbi:sensor histidine kinase [Paracraurococcus lichenis]|uniref:histidine kinase n=1 Tax=Paracraurococcus lichenis TaxID=3064888 RepID=A0ABT9DSS4_9PROT|nr:sensor histidine kinase [Paracraurococcus sp. LOR1-02]MDO9706947.1 sensor histidine kinase [Paracraurococcus sp. LOR1-02]
MLATETRESLGPSDAKDGPSQPAQGLPAPSDGGSGAALLRARADLARSIACDRLDVLAAGPELGPAGPDAPLPVRLAAWLDRAAPGGLIALDRLPPEAPAAGRLLSIALTRERILWLRGAAAPPWSEAERATAAALRTAWLEAALEEAEREAARNAAASQQAFLMAELDHRLKNIMANVQALVRLSRHGATSVEDFISDLEQRLRALAAAHGLLHRSRRQGAQLRALVALELGPHAARAGGRVATRGPDMLLRPPAALALSLALHELATNAAKHGALSVPEGRVWLSWRQGSAGLLLRWHESGGPPVRAPQRRGFGLTVIERSMAHGLGGTSRLEFAASGLRCTIGIPATQLAPVA